MSVFLGTKIGRYRLEKWKHNNKQRDRNKDELRKSNRGMSRKALKGRLNDRVVRARVDVSLTRRRSMRTRQQVATTGTTQFIPSRMTNTSMWAVHRWTRTPLSEDSLLSLYTWSA